MEEIRDRIKRMRKTAGDFHNEEQIITDDTDYYLAVGMVVHQMVKLIGYTNHSVINPFLNAKNTKDISRRLADLFKKTPMLEFANSWAGKLLSEVIVYNPTKGVKEYDNATINMIVGFNTYVYFEKTSEKQMIISEEALQKYGLKHFRNYKLPEKTHKRPTEMEDGLLVWNSGDAAVKIAVTEADSLYSKFEDIKDKIELDYQCDLHTMSKICKIAGVNYDTFRNAKSNNFDGYSNKNVRLLLETIKKETV